MGSDSLYVIALISGGKDSFLSLLHCLANNHRVIALANLYPPATSSHTGDLEDLDSFMYQTAGHAVIPLYSEALGLPLYRQEILGTALIQSKDYHTAPVGNHSGARTGTATHFHEDETESLLPLLRRVMAAHPTANAICSGAILSSYQRTRIESVARRLGLIPLSYLWQYPSLPPPSPAGLLDDLSAAGFDVRIVKVASGGLDEELLWGNLMEPTTRRRVQKGVDRFGGSILGEGGEYETLIVDGPRPLWKGRIEIRPEEMWTGTGGGGQAWINFRKESGVVVKKDSDVSADIVAWDEKIRRPGLWDNEFEASRNEIPQSITRYHPKTGAWEAKVVMSKDYSSLTLYNVTAPLKETTAGEQMLAINSKVMEALFEHSILSGDNIVFTTILLRTMSDFGPVNDAYEQLFTRPNPPARVTVACGDKLPVGVHVMASFIVSLDIASREGLHVQSRSYWAPANIGPYSQAVSMPLQQDRSATRLVYVAGQIPLVPASMEILQVEDEQHDPAANDSLGLFQRRTCLALQHLWRVGSTMKVSWWMDATAFLAGDYNVCERAMVAWKAWEIMHQTETWVIAGHEEDDGSLGNLDAWDLKYGGSGNLAPVESKTHSLPNFEKSSDPTWRNAPPFFAVQVDELPRGCDIEWQSAGIAYGDESTPTVQHLFSYISVAWEDATGELDFQTKILKALDGRQMAEDFEARVYTPRPELVSEISMQVIPCRSVWGPDAQILAAVIVIRNQIKMYGIAK